MWNLFPGQHVETVVELAKMHIKMINIPLRILSVLTVISLLATGNPVFADQGDRIVESGQSKVALLELYTSEGCSSCPPADAFISSLKDSGLPPDRVVPLSFHVTYWDYIGWNDPYAQREFDQRQREIAARRKTPAVYTPQLVLDGQDMRGTGAIRTRIHELNKRQPQATITLAVNASDAGTVALDLDILVPDKKLRANSALFVVLFENQLVSQVQAGENTGKTLQHEYVVRQLVGPLPLTDVTPESRHSVEIALPGSVKPGNAGIVAFVQNRVDGSVLQVLSTQLTR